MEPFYPDLWTPEEGDIGSVVIARRRPLVAVIGGRVLTVGSGRQAPRERREMSVTLGGLIIISASRRSEPTRVVGYPDLASGTSVQQGKTLYVSVAEAIYRQSQGEEVEIHLVANPVDEEALAGFRARARRRWESDRLPDGWTRPLPPVPKGKETPADDLPEELRTLAERIRNKAAVSQGDRRPQ